MTTITCYSTKGGVGKTTTALTLISALAKSNAAAKAGEQMTVVAVDFDAQRSLSKFNAIREDTGEPDYGITFKSLTKETTAQDVLDLESQYDVMILDMPGFYNETRLSMILDSDMVILPTNLDTIEVQETAEAMNMFATLKEKGDFAGNYACVLSRMPPTAFLSGFQKAMLKTIWESRYSMLSVPIVSRPPFTHMMNLGLYLFEQVAKDPTHKPSIAADENADAFLEAIKEWDMMETLAVLGIKDAERGAARAGE